MLQQKPIKELQNKEIVDHFFLLKKIELRQTKTGRDYLSLEFGDKSGSITANYWDGFEEFQSSAAQGSIVKIKGYVESFNDRLQLKIERARVSNQKDKVNVSDFLQTSERNITEMQNEFWEQIEKIKNERLKELLKIIFTEERFEKFSFAPAGKSWHHSYIGGLIEHTLETVKICDLMCDIHPELNRDLLITGALLHDIGKTEELSYESAFDYTDKGRLIGHIVMAVNWIEIACQKIQNFPDELKTLLLHLVLSHQGKLENASPVEPKTLEAIALYHADELSAKTNAYKTLVQQESSETTWTRFHSLIGSALYIPKRTDENEQLAIENDPSADGLKTCLPTGKIDNNIDRKKSSSKKNKDSDEQSLFG
ncbi:MAG: HD domain-containing protein [Bacteroidetes bacterium]|nr:HD domain-containing protein [Bacteroidota bacterium]MBU2583740.1 HD domain-containing protein [Bacteroidota bacterium]